MRRRWIVGIVVLLLLVGRVATLSWAEKSEGLKWKSPGMTLVMPNETKQANFSRPDAPAVEDPMAAVETFLRENQKEADDSIKALSQEAEALRARLQKVEAALGRWKSVSQVLDQQARSGASPLPASASIDSGPPLPPTAPPDPGPQLAPLETPPMPKSIPNPSPIPAPSLPEVPPSIPPNGTEPPSSSPK